MKALVFKRYGGFDQITFADIPRPVPKPDESLVQVHAAGLNPIDNMIPKGTFKPMLRFQRKAQKFTLVGGDGPSRLILGSARVSRVSPRRICFGNSVFRNFRNVYANA